MSYYTLSPVIKNKFNTNEQKAILDYLDRQENIYGKEGMSDHYFAIRQSNGLTSCKRIDVFVNNINTVLLFEIEDL